MLSNFTSIHNTYFVVIYLLISIFFYYKKNKILESTLPTYVNKDLYIDNKNINYIVGKGFTRIQ